MIEVLSSPTLHIAVYFLAELMFNFEPFWACNELEKELNNA